jgi:hypothetical protein
MTRLPPSAAKLRIFPVPQKFNTFNTFNTFAIFEPFIQMRSTVTRKKCHAEERNISAKRAIVHEHEILQVRLRAQNDTFIVALY